MGSGTHIQFNVSANSITILRRTEGGTCSGATFTSIMDPANRTNGYVKTAPSGITLTYTADWPIYFNGLGQALTASDCTVVNSDSITISGGNTVTIVGETGFVQ